MNNKITTYTGKLIDVIHPKIQDINIEDIAFGLSRQYRFNGVTRIPYTVAQHSINVALVTGKGMQLAALLHDASEAYLHDIPTPLKQNLPCYLQIEKNLQNIIYARFGIDQYSVQSGINYADKQVLLSEIDAVALHPELFGRKHGRSLWNITSKLNFNEYGIDKIAQIYVERVLNAINKIQVQF